MEGITVAERIQVLWDGNAVLDDEAGHGTSACLGPDGLHHGHRIGAGDGRSGSTQCHGTATPRLTLHSLLIIISESLWLIPTTGASKFCVATLRCSFDVDST